MFGAKTVLVKMDGNNYSFFSDLPGLEKGDSVVVDTQRGYGIGEIFAVEGLTKKQRGRATKWVMQKVDVEAHKKRLETATIVQEIDNQMEEIMDTHNKYAMYVELAKTNPAMKALVDRLGTVAPSLVPQIEEDSK
jgi:hypothetical protein